MKNFTKIALSGIVGIALTACGSSSSSSGGITPTPPNEVTFQDLNITGVNGYKINVDVNQSGDITENIDYYVCTDGVSNPGNISDDWDYFAVDHNTTPDWNGTTEPDFDYGYIDIDTTTDHLVLTSEPKVIANNITLDENVTLVEGETYSLFFQPNQLDGTVTVNTISDFNCSTLGTWLQ